jgi:hypothetical protein
MKNVFLLPTDKPSRLQLNVNTKKLILFDNIQSNNESVHLTTQNIHITSDEKPKVGDWGYCKSRNKICKVTGISKWTHKDDYSIDLDNENYFIHHSYCKKIILTTDSTLIADGVQAIDDEFLEWFVKNPSCEEVEVEIDYSKSVMNYSYKIIIPNLEVWKDVPEFEGYYQVSNLGNVKSLSRTILGRGKHNTLLKEREPYWDLVDKKAEQNNSIDLDAYAKGVLDGVKWQQERMYSEAIKFGKWLDENTQQREYYPMSAMIMEELFEQFHKKKEHGE